MTPGPARSVAHGRPRPPAARRPWRLLVFGAALLAAAAVSYGLGAVSGRAFSGAPVFYPGLLVYNYAATPLAIAILLVALTLVALWIPQALRRAPRYRPNGVAAALALAGSVLACWSAIPTQFVIYRHVDRVVLNGIAYQLGVRLALDGDNYYSLCRCDERGWVCRCQALTEAGAPDPNVPPELVADAAAGTLSIRVGSRTVYTGSP